MKLLLALVALVIAGLGSAQPYMNAQKPDPNAAKKLAALQKAYVSAKAAYAKKPKDAKVKKAYIDVTVVYGHESMMSQTLDRKVKYKQALNLYREALKLDPKNPIAKKESELIIGIYKQMKRPIPK